jgi:hypothetical protein
MHTIDLAFAGHGIHEELIAYVADQEGYYEDEGVHVAIRDGVGWKTDRLRRGATIGLGQFVGCQTPGRIAMDSTAGFPTCHRDVRRILAIQMSNPRTVRLCKELR